MIRYGVPYTCSTDFGELERTLEPEDYDVLYSPAHKKTLQTRAHTGMALGPSMNEVCISGKIRLKRRTDGKVITINEEDIRAFTHNSDAPFEEILANLQSTEDLCKNILKRSNDHSHGYTQASLLMDAGLDLEALHDSNIRLFRDREGKLIEPPRVPGMRRTVTNFRGEQEPISILNSDSNSYTGELSASALSVDSIAPITQEEKCDHAEEVRRSEAWFGITGYDDFKAVQTIRQQRFAAIAAASHELNDHINKTNALLEKLNTLINEINTVICRVDTDESASDARINWRLVERVIDVMILDGYLADKQAHSDSRGTYRDYDAIDIHSALHRLTQEVTWIHRADDRLFGDDGFLAASGFREIRSLKPTRTLEQLEQATNNLATNFAMLRRPDSSHPRLTDTHEMTLGLIKHWRDAPLRSKMAAQIVTMRTTPRSMNSDRAVVTTEDKAVEQKSAPETDTATAPECSSEITYDTENQRYITCSDEAVTLDEAKTFTDNPLGKLQSTIWQSDEMSAIKAYINKLLNDYNTNFTSEGRPHPNVSADKANYALLGRAKAQALSKIINDIFSGQGSRDDIIAKLDQLASNPHTHSYRVQVPQEDGSAALVQLHIGQHRFDTHQLTNGAQLVAESTTFCSFNCFKIFQSGPTILKLLAQLAAKAKTANEALDSEIRVSRSTPA